MKKLKRLLTTMSMLFTGMLVSSLWIIHNNNWEIYLPIILLCITFKMAIYD